MGKKKKEVYDFTTETRLSTRNAPLVIKQLEKDLILYSKSERYTWSLFTKVRERHKDNKGNLDTKPILQELQERYGITSRYANSVVEQVKGRLEMLKELKKTEQKQRRAKIKSMERAIKRLSLFIEENKPLARENTLCYEALKKYRAAKQKLFYRNRRLGRYKQRYENERVRIERKEYSMSYGTKKLLDKQRRLSENGYSSHEAWYNAFVSNRDKTMYILGRKAESAGNQSLQLEYDGIRDIFKLQLRELESEGISRGKGLKKNFVYGELDFKYMGTKLIEHLHGDNGSNKYPMTYRVLRRGSKWYLQVIIKFEENIKTHINDGVVGLDYNDGFISMVETDGNGVLEKCHDDIILKYRGTGTKAKTEIEQRISEIVCYSLKEGKKYFMYSGMSIHQGAALVISRRGLGILDNL